MPDFKFVPIPGIDSYTILAPKRAKRPDLHGTTHPGAGKKVVHRCPFCPGNEGKEREIYRIGGQYPDDKWQVRVIANKFPFAPFHEVVIHSPDHDHSHISDLSLENIKLIFEAYVNRYNVLKQHGTVVIFRNAGHDAGESIGHSHSQIAVVPKEEGIMVAKLEDDLGSRREHFEVGEYTLMCPPYSQWPDETWIIPRRRGRNFGEIMYAELENLAYVMRRLIRILNIRHGHDFPNNYYIYPYKDWYLRLMPRAKIAGGFEMATGIFVNTQDPAETMDFIKNHFYDEDEEAIGRHKAEYRKGV